jgi:hypothetical protein
MKGLKKLDGYVSNLFWCTDINKEAMHGMKSHVCHIFIQILLSIALCLPHEAMWKPLIE